MRNLFFVLILGIAGAAWAQSETAVTPKMLEVQKHLCAKGDGRDLTEAVGGCAACTVEPATANLRESAVAVRDRAQAQARELAFFEWAEEHSPDMSADLWLYMPGGDVLRAIANAKNEIEYRGRDRDAAQTRVDEQKKIVDALKRLHRGADVPDDIGAPLIREATDRMSTLKGELAGQKRLLKGYEETMASQPGTEAARSAGKYADELKAKSATNTALVEKFQSLADGLQARRTKAGSTDFARLLRQAAEDLKARETARDGFVKQIKTQQDQIKKLEIHRAEGARVEKARLAGLSEADRLKSYEARFKPLIERMAKNPGYQDCGLSPAERFAIYLYSEGAYHLVNPALWGNDAARKKSMQPYVDTFSSALKKLNGYEGEVLRGVDGLPASVLVEYRVGNMVTAAAYTSTSLEKPFPGKVQFVIQSKTGHYISPFCKFWSESEVLFDAGTRFEVTRREDSAQGTKIWMKEVTP